MSSTLFWIVTAVVVVAQAAIIVTALRMRVVTDPARGVLGTRPLEIVWTLLPALLVALVVLASYRELQSG
jgi:heme/copper-type cytochrome/quinol oxidase subunit 2